MLQKIRNMWEFVSLFEWIVLFGQAAKLPSIDVEVWFHFSSPCICVAHASNAQWLLCENKMLIRLLQDFETECVKPQPSQTLEDIGFRLVNWISSRRDIT